MDEINLLLESNETKDLTKLLTAYSKEEIVKAILNHPGLEAKTRNFFSIYFEIPLDKIKSNGLVARMDFDENGKSFIYYEPVSR